MKKRIALLIVLTSVLSAKAQSYLGYYYDNYAGVQSVLYNPASIVDSRFKTDINLASFSASVGNDYYGFSVSDLMKGGDYDFELQSKKFSKNSNNFIVNADVMGPSFMFNIAPKHSLAIFTRGRSIANVRNIDGDLFNTPSANESVTQAKVVVAAPSEEGDLFSKKTKSTTVSNVPSVARIPEQVVGTTKEIQIPVTKFVVLVT